jgi:hypothetical protein
MNKLIHVLLFLLLTTSTLVDSVSAQSLYGRLKIKTTDHNQYWPYIEVIGIDTSVDTWFYTRRIVIDSIPRGPYIVRVESVFNDTIERKVVLDKRMTLKFNFDQYYLPDTGSSSFLERMSNTDTLRIHSDMSGSWGVSSIGQYYILRHGKGYLLNIITESGLKKVMLTDYDIDIIMGMETYARSKEKYSPRGSTRSTWYSFELNSQVIKFRRNRASYFSEIGKSIK